MLGIDAKAARYTLLALLEGIKGPIYISEDPTDLGKLGSPK